MSIGKTMLGRRHVLPSVPSTLTELMVEGTFRCGTSLVTVHHPISSDDGDLRKALYGSFLPIPSNDIFPLQNLLETAVLEKVNVEPGNDSRIVLHEGRKRRTLHVTNKGDRPIQVFNIHHGIRRILKPI